MPSLQSKRYCLTTVSSPEFLPGTIVLLHSFLKTNLWFDGEIIIIHRSLSDREQAKLHAVYKNCRFQFVSDKLVKKIEQLGIRIPSLKNRQTRFFSLEALALENYDKILFCDSDMLFRDSVQEVFSTLAGIAACADGSNNRGNARDKETYEEVGLSSPNSIVNTFNAGFMLFDKSIANQENYNRIIGHLDESFFSKTKSGLTDQILFNIVFDGQQTILDGSYNYLLAFTRDENYSDKTKFSDAKVVHFNGPMKPWHIDKARTASGELKDAMDMWYETYFSALKKDTLTK